MNNDFNNHKHKYNALSVFGLLSISQFAEATTGLGSLAPLQTLILFIVIVFFWFCVISYIVHAGVKDKERRGKVKEKKSDKKPVSLLTSLAVSHVILAVIFISLGTVELKPPYLTQFKYLYFSFAFFLVFSAMAFQFISNKWVVLVSVPLLVVFLIWTTIVQIYASNSVSHYYHFIYSNLTIANISILFYTLFLAVLLLKMQKVYFP